jgi:hypothetical protein
VRKIYSKAGLSLNPQLNFLPTFLQKPFGYEVVPTAVIPLLLKAFNFSNHVSALRSNILNISGNSFG